VSGAVKYLTLTPIALSCIVMYHLGQSQKGNPGTALALLLTPSKHAMTEFNEEKEALATFGIKKFNSEKFENSDKDSILVRSPVKSSKRDLAFAAFCAAIPIEDALPQQYKES